MIAVICFLNPLSSELNTKSVIAYEDIIFKSTQDEKLWKDVSGKEIKYYSDFVAHRELLGQGLLKQMENGEDRKSMLLLWWNLFKLYLRNDHTVLSLFQRTAGRYYLVISFQSDDLSHFRFFNMVNRNKLVAPTTSRMVCSEKDKYMSQSHPL